MKLFTPVTRTVDPCGMADGDDMSRRKARDVDVDVKEGGSSYEIQDSSRSFLYTIFDRGTVSLHRWSIKPIRVVRSQISCRKDSWPMLSDGDVSTNAACQ